jgi:hypothetical protein
LLKTILIRIMICALLCAGAFDCTAAGLSLAILAEDDTASAPADLLTAELTSNPNLKLLERSELKRIIAEQKLTLSMSKDLLEAGRLAGADAILILDYSRAGSTDQKNSGSLALRLILVKQGVLLEARDFSWPPRDIAEWGAATAELLAPQFARAALPEGAAVKLSLLNLRSATDSREARLLDQELNALLLKRLARETNIFVLERQKLGATLLERELNSETSPFWRGSYLIDGTVNKLGYSTNQISLEGRITPPGSQTTNVVEVTGKPDELAAIINQFVGEILKIANQKSTAAWDPAGEGSRYFKEAQWALRWGLLEAAESASDAAWALGKQDEATALLRVQAYSQAVDLSWVRMRVPQKRRLYYAVPPSRESLGHAITALSIFMEWSSRVSPEAVGKEWLKAGNLALLNSSKLLYEFYYMPEARKGVGDELAELRQLCRESAAWLLKSPTVRGPFFLDAQEYTFDQMNVLSEENVFRTMAEFGSLWQEKMSDALSMHRMLLSAPGFPYLRNIYLNQEGMHLPLAGWTWNERRNAFSAWRDFLRELESNTNPVIRIEALFLQTPSIPENEKRFAHGRKIMSEIQQNTNALSHARALLNYEYQLSDVASLSSIPHELSKEQAKVQGEVREFTKTVLNPLRSAQWENAEQRKNSQLAASLLDKQKQFLKEGVTDSAQFFQYFPLSLKLPKDNAETILSLLPEYRTVLSNKLASAQIRERGAIRMALMQANGLEKRINQSLGKEPARRLMPQPGPATNTMAMHKADSRSPVSPQRPEMPFQRRPGDSFRGPRGPLANRGESFIPTPIRTNTLVVHNYKQIPPGLIALSNVVSLQNTSFLPDDNKIWLRTRLIESRQQTGYALEKRGLITSFDPENGVLESIPINFDNTFSFNGFASFAPDFQFWRKELYASGGANLVRFDPERKSWINLPVPLHPKAQLFVQDGRLLILNPDSLLEVEPGGSSVKTWVSARRQPALTPLDSATNLMDGQILSAKEGFRVWVPSTIYQFRNDGFSVLTTFGPNARVYSHQDPGGLLYLQMNSRMEKSIAYLLRSTDEQPVQLFEQSPRESTAEIYHPLRRSTAAREMVWKGLEQFRLDISSTAFSQDNIFVWGKPMNANGGRESVHPGLQQKNYLFVLNPKFKEPIVLDVTMGESVPSIWQRAKENGPRPGLFMAALNDHLVFGNTGQIGLWFVPLKELEELAASAKPAIKERGEP